MKNALKKSISPIQKITIATIAASACLLLAGCHSNPLLSDDNLRKLQREMPDRYFIDDLARPCAAYYADPSLKPALQTQCQAWSVDLYKAWSNAGVIYYKATLADLRDPALWKILKEK